ncbi:MAG: glycosyltransferase family 4 protein [Clostridia bacterium]|nr:glycosyltransferase family 4 protein [Clostridia bacterium]
MKICMVAPLPPPYGGIANWTVLVTSYAQKQSDVQLVGINTAPKKRTLDGRTLFDRVVVQGLAMLKQKKELLSVIKNEHPDAIHITTSGSLATFRDILLLKAAKKKGVSTVYHIRFGRIPEIAEKNTAEWRRIKKALCLSSDVIAIDKKTEAAIRKYAPEASVCYIPNPFDLDALRCKPTDIPKERKKEIVFLGWVVKTKGIEELLGAWEELSVRFPEHTLRIVGPYDGAYLEELKNRFSCKNLIFEGEKSHDEALGILASAELFVLPSYTEGFPNAVLEAMALEVPVVGTDVGAIPDMLEGCGKVIAKQNIKALQAALSDLLLAPEEGRRLGQKGRERLEQEYRIDRIFEEYKTLWMKGVQHDL